MIKNIVFDCADTLLRFHAKADLGVRLQDAARAEAIHNAFFKSEIWPKYDNGLVSEEEVLAAVLPRLPEEDRQIGAEYLDDFINHFTPIDGMEELLKELKEKGYALYILSDFPCKFPKLWDNFDLFRSFDGRAVSFEVHGSKRDLQLFDYLQKTYGLKAEECVYVDDWDAMIENGISLGYNGHIFRGVENLRCYLKQMQVL